MKNSNDADWVTLGKDIQISSYRKLYSYDRVKNVVVVVV